MVWIQLQDLRDHTRNKGRVKITASIAYLSSKKIKNFVINSFIADGNTKIISFKLSKIYEKFCFDCL